MVVNEVSPEYNLQAKLGDVIGLRGYDLQQTAENLNLKVYWESLTPAGADYTLFVHLRNQADETVAQMDQPLTQNVYPSSLWSPGELIPDTVTIPLPNSLPSGEYSLWVGLYDFATGQRLPIAGSTDNSLLLTRITIPD
jgi:hypothetical protein